MNWTWSYVVWSAWLTAFIVLELLAVFGLVPWHTLSGTSHHSENTYGGWVTVPLFGFIMGLSFHISLRLAGHYVDFWKAVLFGLILSAGARFLLSPLLP